MLKRVERECPIASERDLLNELHAKHLSDLTGKIEGESDLPISPFSAFSGKNFYYLSLKSYSFEVSITKDMHTSHFNR